jgi:Na+-driven multidrug efflux pump
MTRTSNSPITRKDLDRLAVPAIISGIAEPVISLVDTAFVGRLGTADLAAVGIASSFFLSTRSKASCRSPSG